MTKHLLFITFLLILSSMVKAQDADPNFASFDIESILSEMDESNSSWKKFFDGQNLFTGIYRLKTGASDGQQPHQTDEVYYVLSGKAKFRAGEEVSDISTGQILFVKANIDHQFFDIKEELVLLVFFDK